MKKIIITVVILLTTACSNMKSIYVEDHDIDCHDLQTKTDFTFNTGEVTTLSGLPYGNDPFFVKGADNEYMLVDNVTAVWLTCSEEIFTYRR